MPSTFGDFAKPHCLDSQLGYDHSPLQVTEAAIVFMSRPAQPLGTGHAARGAASAAYQLIRACGMPYIRRENSSPVT